MRFKRVVGIVAIILVLLAAAAYLILSTYDYNRLKPRISQAAKDATGRELTLAGDLDVKIGLSPMLTAKQVTLQNAPWGSRPELATLDRLELQIGLFPLLFGRIEVKSLVLVKPDILIEIDRSGKSNLEFKSAEKSETTRGEKKEQPEPFKFPALSLRQVLIVSGNIFYKNGKTHTLQISNLSANSNGFTSPLSFELKGSYNTTPFEAGGNLGALKTLSEPGKAWPLELTVEASDTKGKIKGSIRDVFAGKDLNLTVNVQARSLSQIAKLLEVTTKVPDMGLLKVDFKVSDPEPKAYRIADLMLTLADSDLSGSGEISLAQDRPKFTAKLSSKNLDLRPFFSELPAKSESKKPANKRKKRSPKVFPNDPLPVDSLNRTDARIEFRAGRLLLPGLALQDLSLDLALEKGSLVLDPIKAVIGGGNMHSTLELHPRGDEVGLATTVKIENFDIGLPPKELGVSNIIDGTIELVDIDLNSSGRSVADIMASLNGKTVIIMGKGKLNNEYIDLAGKYLGGDLFRLLNPVRDKGTQTIGNCLVCRLDIDKGIAKTKPLLYDTETMSVVAAGDINLRKEELNLAFRPLPKKGVANYSMSLGKLAEPFKLGGTLADPSLKVDRRGAAKTFGKAAGGFVLLGPAGLAAVLFVDKTAEKNPCLAAVKELEEKIQESKGEKKKKK